jgi:hypothetical protein
MLVAGLANDVGGSASWDVAQAETADEHRRQSKGVCPQGGARRLSGIAEALKISDGRLEGAEPLHDHHCVIAQP